MSIDVGQIAQDFEAVAQDGGDYIFYRRPDGSICEGQVGKGGFLMFQRMAEGWQPLQSYGTFAWTEYHAEHPFEPLLMRDGARELGVEQLVEMGYHLRPPKVPTCGLMPGEPGHGPKDRRGRGRTRHTTQCWRGAESAAFPQLDGLDLPPATDCTFCFRDDFPTPRSRDQHLWVMHKDEMVRLRQDDEMAKTIAGAMKAMGAQPRPYLCGLCSEGFEDVAGLQGHAHLHDEVDPVARRGPGRPRKEIVHADHG